MRGLENDSNSAEAADLFLQIKDICFVGAQKKEYMFCFLSIFFNLFRNFFCHR
jgi:hypothetical protein